MSAKLTGEACQCPTCGFVFRSVTGFDAHRVGDYPRAGRPSTRRCLDAGELVARGYVVSAAGKWQKAPEPDNGERARKRWGLV